MRVLVIGGGGHLGTHLVPKLKLEGHEVAICDNLSGCPRIKTDGGTRLFTPNVTDLNSTRQAFSIFKPEVVVFAAAHHFTRDIIYKFFDDTKLVLDGANVLATLLSSSVRHVYFCSSSEVYGGPQTKKPLKESRKITSSATHHGAAKLAAENLLAFRCKELGIGYTGLRIFDMFGPRKVFCPRTGIISFLIDSFSYHPRETVGMVGASRLRDFIHVEDVAEALVALIDVGPSGTINLGTGVGTSLIQVVRELAKHIEINNPPMIVPDGPIPVMSAVADMATLRSILPDWSPSVEVLSSLPELIVSHKQVIDFNTGNPLGVLNATRGI